MNKKLYRLIIKAYLGPFLVTFCIAMFFLVMQFLWKYIDDLMGKGLEFSILAELMFYASANLVPMALPIAILLSSIMTFGNLAETNEMTAMKSAGLSNLRIMRPLIYFILIISFCSFLFANYTWPVANLKFRALITDIVQQKPTIQFREKVFYTDIDNYCIRVDKKIKDKNDFFEGIHISDHSNNPTNNPLYKKDIAAKSGNIKKTSDGKFMVLTLDNGNIREELIRGIDSTDKFAHQTTYYEEAKMRIDLSSLKMHRTDADLFKGMYEMYNMGQLEYALDSVSKHNKALLDNYSNGIKRSFLIFREPIAAHQKLNLDSLQAKASEIPHMNASINDLKVNVNPASQGAITLRNYISTYEFELATIKNNEETMQLMKVEWHRKLTLPASCLILFFIGASLGTIVKKGGIGTPVVIAVILFLIYYIITMTGEKMAKGGVMTAFGGMWLSAFILTPLALILISKSNSDSRIFELETYKRIFSFKKGQKK